MREILFRGKRCDNGEWVEGLPIKTYDTEIGKNSVDYSNPVPVVLMASGRIVLECGYDEIPFFNIDEYPIVNPETISQYTGLTDKNGTRIFEGDILKFYGEDGDEESYTKYEVIWLEKGWHAQDVHRLYMADTLSPSSWVKEHFEVIGNIHDNPELLEGDD